MQVYSGTPLSEYFSEFGIEALEDTVEPPQPTAIEQRHELVDEIERILQMQHGHYHTLVKSQFALAQMRLDSICRKIYRKLVLVEQAREYASIQTHRTLEERKPVFQWLKRQYMHCLNKILATDGQNELKQLLFDLRQHQITQLYQWIACDLDGESERKQQEMSVFICQMIETAQHLEQVYECTELKLLDCRPEMEQLSFNDRILVKIQTMERRLLTSIDDTVLEQLEHDLQELLRLLQANKAPAPTYEEIQDPEVDRVIETQGESQGMLLEDTPGLPSGELVELEDTSVQIVTPSSRDYTFTVHPVFEMMSELKLAIKNSQTRLH
ncbi:hypothetical protein EDD86DRAFT_2483 [Gorgonomyces haynaldii]|nr:hypothetical protein EDD86DRAFT_2483 [Gorgonomyces haynaldii]